MDNQKPDTIVGQTQQLIHDTLEYISSAIELWQARLAEYALSFVVFSFLLFFASLLLITAFVFGNIVLGMWLTHLLGHVGWALLVLGSSYGILALILGGLALRWMSRLKS